VLVLHAAHAGSIVVNGRVIEITVPDGLCALDARTRQELFVDLSVPRSPAIFVAQADCAELAAMRQGIPAAAVRMIIVAVPREHVDNTAGGGFDWIREFTQQAGQADEFLKLVQPNLVARSVAAERMEMRDARITVAPIAGRNREVVAQVRYDYQIGRYAAGEDVHVAATVLNGVPLLVSSIWPGAADDGSDRPAAFATYLSELARANPSAARPSAARREWMYVLLSALAMALAGGVAFVLRDV
jgi:hypothetical protein